MVDLITSDPTPSAQQIENQTDVDLLLHYLSAHKMEFVQAFLRERQLPYSFTKAGLVERLREYLQNGHLRFEELVELLNKIEGWGNQQVYLYQAPGPLSRAWRDIHAVRRILGRTGYGNLLNNPLPLVMPEETTLSSVEWTENRVRFLWIEKRYWKERATEEDRRQPIAATTAGALSEEIIWQAYRVRIVRGLVAFDWDTISGKAMLLIQRLPSGSGYVSVREQFEHELQQLFAIDSFERIRVSSALRRLEQRDETRKHYMKFESDNRSHIAVTSPSANHDVFADDPVVERTRKALADEASGLLGRFYWKPVAGKLSREVYTYIYGEQDDDQRVGILAEHLESDVRYVLSRIRSHCI